MSCKEEPEQPKAGKRDRVGHHLTRSKSGSQVTAAATKVGIAKESLPKVGLDAQAPPARFDSLSASLAGGGYEQAVAEAEGEESREVDPA